MSMLLYIVQVSTYLLFFYGFYHLFLRKETMFHTNRIYLVTTLVVSLVLPLVKIYIDSQNANSNVVLASSVYVGNYVNDFSSSITAPEVKAIPWMKILLWFYLLGVAVMTVRLLLALKQILHLRKTGIHTKVAGHLCILSAEVNSPFSFFNTIFLPLDHAFSDEELNEVISHEMAHVYGLHTWDVILMELLCIKLWPSPMIYLYRKSLKEVHEYVADAAVLKETPWENYAQLLVTQQQGQLQNILSNQLIYSQLKKRLLMMNKERSGFAARYKYLGIVPVLLIALVLFSFREKMAPQVETNLFSNDTQQEKKLILYVAADHKMYFGLKEVSKDELESSLKEEISTMSDLVLTLRMEKSLTVQDLSDILLIVQKLNIRTILDTDEQTDYSKSDESPNDTNVADTLPEVALENSSSKEEPLMYAEELPRFPGCEYILSMEERTKCSTRNLYEFIYATIKYPEADRRNGIEGQCIVQFVIGADGSISDVKVIRSPSESMKEEVIRIMNAMAAMPEKWIPARQDGKAVSMRFTLPIKFKMQNDEPIQEISDGDDFTKKEEPLMYAEELPRFPGCEDITNAEERSACAAHKMYEFIFTNINYPKEDRENNIQGHCIVQFVIEVDGSISDINVRRSPSESMKQEVIRLMNLMSALPDKWIPARQDGKDVAMRFTLPVKFLLQDETKKDPQAAEPMDPNIKVYVISQRENAAEKSADPVASNAKAKTVVVVPNPATESITVDLIEGTNTITIFDLSGNLVLTHKITSKSIDKEAINISSLPSGRYTVQLLTSKGSATGAFTVIK